MTERKISLLGIRPVHPGRGEPSQIVLTIVLDYLNGAPVTSAILTYEETVRLIERAAQALAIVYPKESSRG